jgi:hypothetical protein
VKYGKRNRHVYIPMEAMHADPGALLKAKLTMCYIALLKNIYPTPIKCCKERRLSKKVTRINADAAKPKSIFVWT